MATLSLLGIDGSVRKQWEIGDMPMTIGRGTPVDVRLEDEGLSRRHFTIVREGEEYVVRDLASRNGTWVHGQRALAARLHHNDCILAGHTLFRFCENNVKGEFAPQPGIGPHGTQILQPALAETE
jgi:pSer/pThr/pTyr-binding forkhead associated (FHA) protein